MTGKDGTGADPGESDGCDEECGCTAELEQAREWIAALKLLESKNRTACHTHDSLAQGLGAILWQLNAIELQVNDHPGAAELLPGVQQAQELAWQALREAQDSVDRLTM